MEKQLNDVRAIADTLGRRAIAERVGVKPGSVTEAIRAEVFPASWFMAVTDLGAEHDLDVPAALFHWAGPSGAPVAGAGK